jgi:hypothetical protein
MTVYFLLKKFIKFFKDLVCAWDYNFQRKNVILNQIVENELFKNCIFKKLRFENAENCLFKS